MSKENNFTIDDFSVGVMDEAKSDEIREIFGDRWDAIAEANSKLLDKQISGEVNPEDITFNDITDKPHLTLIQ